LLILFTRVDVLDLYEVGDVLGRGGFATVRLGRQKNPPHKDVALKILNPKYLTNVAQARATFHELKVLRMVNSINNSHMMKYLGAHEDSSAGENRKLCIVTELCSGGELFDRIVKKGHFSEKEAADTVFKLASALHALHQHGIVHRDIKPENILLSSKADDAEPMLADFGLAKILGLPEVMSSLVGTPGYLAPEIVTKREYSPSVDVWALGVISYILLCGYPPFYSEDTKTLYKQIAAGAYEFHADSWDQISPSAKELIRSMLTVDPTRRITLPEVMKHPWITTHSKLLVARLTSSLQNLRSFNAKRKIRAVTKAALLSANLLPKRIDINAVMGNMLLTLPQICELALKLETKSSKGRGHLSDFSSTVVTLEDLSESLAEIGASDVPAKKLFDLFDTDKSGDISYYELMVGLARLRGHTEESLKACFDIFDLDKNGALSYEELEKLLVTAGPELFFSSEEWSENAAPASAVPTTPDVDMKSTSVSTDADEAINAAVRDTADQGELTNASRLEKLEKIFLRMDVNNDGLITFAEFKAAIFAHDDIATAMLGPQEKSKSMRFTLPGKSNRAL
jgi:calcium-dependent protein kinase